MQQLVAIDLPGGPAFVDTLRRTWDDGDAVLPIDRRLPGPARAALLEAARPASVVDETGRRPLDPDAPPVGSDDAVVVASSGTTGNPKLVVHTHESVRAHATAVHRHLGITADDRWLACLPLSHLGGLGVVLRSIAAGTQLDVIDGFDARTVAAAPRELGSTLVSVVATALDRIDPSPFRWVVLGGSADPGDRPRNVVRTYGLTETGGGVVYDGVPLPGIEVRVADDGSVSVRSATIARGLRRPDGDVTALVDHDGWLATGDVGRWDRHGRLQIDGRSDDLIVTGGENVWPTTVEAVLATHPGVAEVAVVGRPDPTWGERVVAIVVPVDRSTPPRLEDLRDHVRATLPAFAAPHQLDLTESLPRTALGKVARARLTEPRR